MCYPSNMLHYFMFSLRFCGWLCPITSEGVKSGIWASEGEILNAPLSTTATQAIYCKTACRHRDPLSYPVCCSCSCFYFYIRQTEAAACTQRTLPQSGGGGGVHPKNTNKGICRPHPPPTNPHGPPPPPTGPQLSNPGWKYWHC